MEESIYELKEFGYIQITIKDVMLKRSISRNKLANLTGIVYNTINRYYHGEPITSIDLINLAKICYVLNCQISDVLQYQPPQEGLE